MINFPNTTDSQTLKFCVGNKINQPQGTVPCTVGQFKALLEDAKVAATLQQLADLEHDETYESRKKELKDSLPCFIFGASRFVNDYRLDKNAEPSGFAMLDVDKIADVEAFLAQFGDTRDAQVTSFRICGAIGAHISPSGHGMHFIISLRPGESIKEAQARVARNLGIDEYDEGCYNVSRTSFVVSSNYWLFLDMDELVADCKDIVICDTPTDVVACNGCTAVVKCDTGSTEPLPIIINKESEEPEIEEAEIIEEIPNDPKPKEDTYETVPLSLLAQRILTDVMGLTTMPSAHDHNRHNTYLKLLSYFRYFCDFDQELMYRYAPNWGLEEKECRDACRDAAKYDRVMGIPRNLQLLLDKAKAEVKEASTVPTFSQARLCPMPTAVPRLFQLLFKLFPKEFHEQLFVASMMWLGALTTALRYRHNSVVNETTTFLIYVVGPMASGKSFTRYLDEILAKPIDADDEIANAREQEWSDEYEAAGQGKKQKRLHQVIRRLDADFTLAALNRQLLDSRGQHILLFCEESDSLQMTRQFSAKLRQAFDGVRTGQSRAMAQSVNGRAATHLSFLMCGTPGAMRKMFPSSENGDVSRFCFLRTEQRLGLDEPVYGTLTEREQTELAQLVMNLHQIGLVEHPEVEGEDAKELSISDLQPEHTEVYIKMPRLEKRLQSWKRARALEFEFSGRKDVSMAVFSRRIPTFIRRMGMVLYACEGMKETSRSLDLCMWAADYLLQNLLDIFGQQYEEIYHQDQADHKQYVRHHSNEDILDCLPEVFSIDDVMQGQLTVGKTMSIGAANTLVSRWKAKQFIEVVPGKIGRWKKLAI